MQLLMFSGNSQRNQDWIYNVEAHVSSLFDSTYIQDYRHWETDDAWIDLEYELSILQQRVRGLQQPYGVFAKSIGTVLAIQAIQRNIIKPKFLLFCGIPLNFITENHPQFVSELKACSLPAKMIHNKNDTIGSVDELKKYLGRELSSKIEVTPGNTHDYEDYALLKAELVKLRGIA